jgi:hypothetical protein
MGAHRSQIGANEGEAGRGVSSRPMPREPFSPLRRSLLPELGELGLRLGVALFVVLGAQAWAALGPQLARAAETRYLGVLAGLVLVGIPSRWAPAAGAGVLLAIVALAAPGPLRPTVATAVLVGFWWLGNGLAILRQGEAWPRPYAETERWTGGAVSASSPRRRGSMFSPRLLLHLVLAFFAAHALLRPQWVLELSQGSRATLAAFGLVAVAVALLGWLVAMRLPRRLPRLPGLRYLAGGLVLVAATAMLLTAYPWLRARPVRDALSLVEVLARPAAPVVAIERGSVVLTAADPRFEVALEGRAVREVLVDAHLVHAANLPAATPVLALRLERVSGPVREDAFYAGLHLAEWAARRPDVAALPGFEAPAPFRAELAPDGSFFGQIYRARFFMKGASPMTELVLERSPQLPPEVAVVLFRVEAR